MEKTMPIDVNRNTTLEHYARVSESAGESCNLVTRAINFYFDAFDNNPRESLKKVMQKGYGDRTLESIGGSDEIKQHRKSLREAEDEKLRRHGVLSELEEVVLEIRSNIRVIQSTNVLVSERSNLLAVSGTELRNTQTSVMKHVVDRSTGILELISEMKSWQE